jgi:biotin transporter BioY
MWRAWLLSTLMTAITVVISGRPSSIDSMMIAETCSRLNVRLAGMGLHRRAGGGNVLVYLRALARMAL